MAATRLRRTFQYPSESDDEDAVEQGMDEQDQDNLITTLSTHDASSTRMYTYLLLALPLAPTLLYIPRLLSLSTFPPSVLAIASLLASAYTLYFVPLPPVKVGIINTSSLKIRSKGKKKFSGGYGYNVPTSEPQPGKPERRPVPYLSDEAADLVAKYTVPANAAACVLLAILELWQGRTWSEGIMIGGGYLPGLVLSIVLWARRELRVVDMTELEKLKFRGKGI